MPLLLEGIRRGCCSENYTGRRHKAGTEPQFPVDEKSLLEVEYEKMIPIFIYLFMA